MGDSVEAIPGTEYELVRRLDGRTVIRSLDGEVWLFETRGGWLTVPIAAEILAALQLHAKVGHKRGREDLVRELRNLIGASRAD